MPSVDVKSVSLEAIELINGFDYKKIVRIELETGHWMIVEWYEVLTTEGIIRKDSKISIPQDLVDLLSHNNVVSEEFRDAPALGSKCDS